MDKCILCEKNFKKRELIGIRVEEDGQLFVMNYWSVHKFICVYCAFYLKEILSFIDFETIEIKLEKEDE